MLSSRPCHSSFSALKLMVSVTEMGWPPPPGHRLPWATVAVSVPILREHRMDGVHLCWVFRLQVRKGPRSLLSAGAQQ